MIIVHKVNDLLFSLFPKALEQGKSMEALKEALIAYYTFGPFRPKVEIEGDFVKIEIDTSTIASQKAEFDTVVKHCERGNFSQAKPILEKLIKKNPTNSEYYRILGQILSEEGQIDAAVNNLHNALRWNSKNTHALTMLGNIFARNMNDITTISKRVRPGWKKIPILLLIRRDRSTIKGFEIISARYRTRINSFS